MTLGKKDLSDLVLRVQQLYLRDEMPWVVGYSGGKDSTATLQLVWNAIAALPNELTHKPIHVISTDTLVEHPLVAKWVSQSLEMMARASMEQGVPILPHRLTPDPTDSFWVNLIGRGYPAPRPTFRWCTSRLKINPSNRFIREIVKTHGETILVLGTRKAESTRRAANMTRHERKRLREFLSPNASLPNSWVFTPLEDWSNDDVWFYLMQFENPWGRSNKDLLSMYRGASPDNECPLVVDSSTPSCGNSRFGCWTCTLVSTDKSMEAMIQNDQEKQWMTPLLEFRNELASVDAKGRINDRYRRDFRRMDGSITLMNGCAVHGPYTRPWRHHFLKRLLQIQVVVNETSPAELRPLVLVTEEELREIRRIWLEEKHEFEDAMPRLYYEVTGRPWPDTTDESSKVFGEPEWRLLEELCDPDTLRLELLSWVLDLEQRAQSHYGRAKMVELLENAIRRSYYENEEDAVDFAVRRQGRFEAIQLGIDYAGPNKDVEF